jgi:hypothetical protein
VTDTASINSAIAQARAGGRLRSRLIHFGNDAIMTDLATRALAGLAA